MIVSQHPIVTRLHESPFRCHLVGSRMVGPFDRGASDYDFLVECLEYQKKDDPTPAFSDLRKWLEANSFVIQSKNGVGYGPDSRMVGTAAWTWTDPAKEWPAVDVLPVTPEEAARRLAFFTVMAAVGHDRGGKLSLALKQGKQWATLWECLARYTPPGGV